MPNQETKKKELEFHPLAEGYDLLEGEDFDELCESIQTFGLDNDGIIVLHEGKILDGRNRYRACLKVGIEPRFRDYDETSDGPDPAEFVRRRNDPRRHDPLTIRKQRRKGRRQRIAQLHQQGDSTRTIAEKENISQTQVRRDLENPTGEPPQGSPDAPTENPTKTANYENQGLESRPSGNNGKVTGKDGKNYPSKPQPATPPKKVAAKAKEAIENNDEPETSPTDALGVALPKSSLESFASLELFDEIDKAFRNLATLINDLATKPGAELCRAELRLKMTGDKENFYSADLTNARSAIKSTRPHAAICPYCHHDGRKKPSRDCPGCKGLPFVSKRVWDAAPDDYKQAVLDDAKGVPA